MGNIVLQSTSETDTNHRTLPVIYRKWHVYLHTPAKVYMDYFMFALTSLIILLRQHSPSVVLEQNNRAGYTSAVDSPFLEIHNLFSFNWYCSNLVWTPDSYHFDKSKQLWCLL